MSNDALAVAGTAAIEQQESQVFQQVVDQCFRISEEIRTSNLQRYWKIGEVLGEELLRRRDDNIYGQRLVASVEKRTGIDHSTLYRAVSLWDRLTWDEICAARHISWSKAKLILGFRDSSGNPRKDIDFRAERNRLYERIESGELRTDEQVRTAIFSRMEKLGLITREGLRADRDLATVPGHLPHVLQGLFNKLSVPERVTVGVAVIRNMGIERLPRDQALPLALQLEQEASKLRAEIDGRSFRVVPGGPQPLPDRTTPLEDGEA